jgi:hypothetical protein
VKLGLVADIHLGNHRACGGPVFAGVNDRAREVAATLADSMVRASRAGCERFIIAGDLFDVACPSPQIVRLAQEALESAAIPTFILTGNHDIESTAGGDNALGPLRAIPHVQVIEKTTVVGVGESELVLIPFQPGDARKWIPAEVQALGPATRPSRVVVTHTGLIDEYTEVHMAKAHDAIEVAALQPFAASHGLFGFFAGNWHGFKAWKVGGLDVCQIGSLTPTGWDNLGMSSYGSLIVYDAVPGGKLTRIVVPGPRFLNVSDAAGVQDAADSAGANRVYVRWSVGPDGSLAEAGVLAAQLVAEGKLRACTVVADTTGAADTARAAARGAAARARSAGSDGLDTVLAAFVGSMALAEGIDRGAVLAEARRFLAAG